MEEKRKVGIKLIIIGEKINGAIPRVAAAIRARDAQTIIDIAQLQIEAGANYLDICAGSTPQEEYDDLVWLLDVVQGYTDVPISIDSPDPRILERVFPLIKRPGIINSISGEGEKCDILLPILRDNPKWQVVALCCDNNGIAASTEDKVRIAFELIEKAAQYGVSPDRIHIDPLVLALSAVNTAAVNFCDAIRQIKEKYPTVKITAALSNVSYGMPVRKLINQTFLTIALAAGLDSGIVDPARPEIIETVFAAEALLGKDRLCRKYNNAYRSGRIGSKK